MSSMTLLPRLPRAVRLRRIGVASLALSILFSISFSGAALAADGAVYTVQVNGLACPFCTYGVEKQLYAIDGVAKVEIEIKTGVVTITMEGAAVLTEAAAKAAVEDAGFEFGGLSNPADASG